jgi:hypothetical protein
MPRGRATCLLALALLAAWAPSPLRAQASAFHYRAERAPAPGTVWHFTKSNRDGSAPWQLDAFVASPTRIEVVKWVAGALDFVEVHADLDLATAQPVVIQQWNTTVAGGRQPSLWAVLPHGLRELRLELAAGQTLAVPFAEGPFHVWGFDLMGLAMLLPHLAAPAEAFSVTFLDPNRPGADGAPVTVGVARFTPTGEEVRGGVPSRRYELAGPVFGEARGAVWVSLADGTLVAAEHAVRTSTDWLDFRLERTGVETLSGNAWERFKAGLVGQLASPPPAKP